ncbi:MAG TPA: hypothetical protein VEV61_15380 [Streptosporangiaceae bacterium]|nr:hypothetical protein [Streptosporangiaceae bacterium]
MTITERAGGWHADLRAARNSHQTQKLNGDIINSFVKPSCG